MKQLIVLPKEQKWNANTGKKDVKDRTATLNILKAKEDTEQPTDAGTNNAANATLETSAGTNRKKRNPPRNAQMN